MKNWEVDYKGHKIRVENSWSKGESLYVNDELQDQRVGFALRSRLYGVIKRNDNIKLTLFQFYNSNILKCFIINNHSFLSLYYTNMK